MWQPLFLAAWEDWRTWGQPLEDLGSAFVFCFWEDLGSALGGLGEDLGSGGLGVSLCFSGGLGVSLCFLFLDEPRLEFDVDGRFWGEFPESHWLRFLRRRFPRAQAYGSSDTHRAPIGVRAVEHLLQVGVKTKADPESLRRLTPSPYGRLVERVPSVLGVVAVVASCRNTARPLAKIARRIRSCTRSDPAIFGASCNLRKPPSRALRIHSRTGWVHERVIPPCSPSCRKSDDRSLPTAPAWQAVNRIVSRIARAECPKPRRRRLLPPVLRSVLNRSRAWRSGMNIFSEVAT